MDDVFEGEDVDEMERGAVDPDHPASLVQCDHIKCRRDSPEGRLCELCEPIMLARYPDECPHCGVSLTD